METKREKSVELSECEARKRSENLVVEGDEAHADVRTLHAQCLDALQHGLLDKLEFNQIILGHRRYFGCRDTSEKLCSDDKCPPVPKGIATAS